MPSRMIPSQATRQGAQSVFSFGGGSNTVFAADDGVSPFGYVIDTGGGDDTIFGSDFTGRGAPAGHDPRTTTGDVLVGGDGSDTILGGAGDDVIFGGHEDGSTDAGKGKDAQVQNTLVGDGERLADGSLGDMITFAGVSTFDGGDDTLTGGAGAAANTLHGEARFVLTTAGTVFNGGDDRLVAGDGGTNTMFGDVQVISGGGTVNGGDDVLVSGTGNDWMVGDWSNDLGFTGTANRGADTFVFGPGNGLDIIADFTRAQDLIDLTATDLAWTDLDSDGSGVLDDSDAFVDILGGTSSRLNLGAAIANDGSVSGDFVVVSNVVGLTEADFRFADALV